MQKIKLAMIVGDLNIHGISSVVVNYAVKLSKKNYEVTILAGIPIDDYYLEICNNIKLSIIALPSRKKETVRYYSSLSKVLSSGYDIVHIHGNSATITGELFLAWMHKIPVRIVHGHSSSCKHKLVDKILRPLFYKLSTGRCACSVKAGEWLFGNKSFEVVENGFDVNTYQFSMSARVGAREELAITDRYVVGHIGRFNDEKNQEFLLQLFKEYAFINQESCLLLVGTGPNYNHIKNLVDNHPYKERIILYGESKETAKLYSAMDVFVFPSKHEGLGIVTLEAQINGLPCIVSDEVPKDVALSDQITFLSLQEDKTEWLNMLDKYRGCIKDADWLQKRKHMIVDNYNSIKRFEIRENVKKLDSFYKKEMSKS